MLRSISSRLFRLTPMCQRKFIPIFQAAEPNLDRLSSHDNWKKKFYREYAPALAALKSEITNPIQCAEIQENIEVFGRIFNNNDPSLAELQPAIRLTRQFLRTYCHGDVAWKEKGDSLLKITDNLMMGDDFLYTGTFK